MKSSYRANVEKLRKTLMYMVHIERACIFVINLQKILWSFFKIKVSLQYFIHTFKFCYATEKTLKYCVYIFVCLLFIYY